MMKEGKAKVNKKYDRHQINLTAHHKKASQSGEKENLAYTILNEQHHLLVFTSAKIVKVYFVEVYISLLSKTSETLDCSGNPKEKVISQYRL